MSECCMWSIKQIPLFPGMFRWVITTTNVFQKIPRYSLDNVPKNVSRYYLLAGNVLTVWKNANIDS